jgi:hypothetical protein
MSGYLPRGPLAASIAGALLMLAASAALALVSPVAFAHGDAEWIMENPATKYCCGPNDCARLAAGAVTADGDGWIFEGRRFAPGDRNVHQSRDADFWACRYPGGDVRCFFYPPPGV